MMPSNNSLSKYGVRYFGNNKSKKLQSLRNDVSRFNLFSFFCGCIAGGFVVFFTAVNGFLFFPQPTAEPQQHYDNDAKIPAQQDCEITLGKYHGRESRPNQMHGATGTTKCLVNTKFLKLSLHTNVQPSTKAVVDYDGVSPLGGDELNAKTNSQDRKGSPVINDWVWIDYHDRVNIVVQTTTGDFLVFEQTKYALEGRLSFAIVGGIVEPGENPRTTAQREVDEEMNLVCAEYHYLGRFVTDVNRGMGWLNSFLATGCQSKEKPLATNEEAEKEEQVGARETELQILKHMSLEQVQEAYSKGKFLEAQWTATIGLALRHPSLRSA